MQFMDGFANHNRLYYVSMYSQYQGDVDDGLHIYFVGSNSLLGNVVVVSCGIRFGGILSLWVNNQLLLPTN